MRRFVVCWQTSTMTSIPSSSMPFGAWAICWMSPMTIKKPAIFGRPTSLAARVTWLVAVAMMLVFLMFNWISIGSLDRHFAEMDEEELGVIARSVRSVEHTYELQSRGHLVCRLQLYKK